MRLLHPQLDAPSLTVFHLGLEQGFEIVQVGVVTLASLFGERGELRTDGW